MISHSIKRNNKQSKSAELLLVYIHVVILTAVSLTSCKSKVEVDTSEIKISEVRKSSFADFVPATGVVLPASSMYLEAKEDGRIEEKLVTDGAIVQKGQPIYRLSNTDLELDLVSRDAATYDFLTQLQIAKNAAQLNSVTRENQKRDLENALREAKKEYERNKYLFENKAISIKDFQDSEANYQALLEKKKLNDGLLKNQENIDLKQVANLQNSFKGSQQALNNIMKKKVSDLIVRSPITGRIASLNAEVGETKLKGQRLGQIDLLTGYKIRTYVDEETLTRVYAGLPGELTLNGKTYPLKVVKVYSDSRNGKSPVDLQFVGEVPADIKRGQRLDLNIGLTTETGASFLIDNGSFIEDTKGKWVYRLKEDGKTAERVNIELGQQVGNFYLVKKGLKEKDRIITSGYAQFKNAEEIVLK